VLVNNAGISRGAEYPPECLPHEIWDQVLSVNLRGSFFCAQAVGKHMIAQGKGGSIINMASIAGSVVLRVRDRHPLAYSVSKAGVMMMTKVLAAEWAQHNIRVNAIAPAYMKTAIIHPDPRSQEQMIRDTPLRRLGLPEDLAGSVIYLASEASAYVTGHVLFVDGGYTIW
jgi:NAD(P)-dependent dehydrogenase (short-subunit alcohol dehydrogenase family)